MFGFLGFAIATGILYGRFSRPSARILYSNNAIFTRLKGQGKPVDIRLKVSK